MFAILSIAGNGLECGFETEVERNKNPLWAALPCPLRGKGSLFLISKCKVTTSFSQLQIVTHSFRLEKCDNVITY